MRLLLCFLLLFPLAASAGKKKKNDVPAPEWVDAPPAGCGAGSSIYDRNMREISKVEAEANARADLSRSIHSHVSSIIKNSYSKQTNGGETTGKSSAVSVTKVATDQSLTAARKTHTEIAGATMYILVCIQPEGLKKVFEEMAYLDETLRFALGEASLQEFSAQAAHLARITH